MNTNSVMNLYVLKFKMHSLKKTASINDNIETFQFWTLLIISCSFKPVDHKCLEYCIIESIKNNLSP